VSDVRKTDAPIPAPPERDLRGMRLTTPDGIE
jgi:hypothetical protein